MTRAILQRRVPQRPVHVDFRHSTAGDDRVGVMESGRRWPDSAIPKSNWDITRYLWQPEAEMYGLQRLTYLDDVLVLHGAGVGGGSHNGSTLYVPPKKFFDAPEWSYITEWKDEMPAYFDQAQRMLTQVANVKRDPFEQTVGFGQAKSAMELGGSLGSPSTAYLYDWNMLPIGQQLWFKELYSYQEFPPLQAAETYILQEMEKHKGDD